MMYYNPRFMCPSRNWTFAECKYTEAWKELWNLVGRNFISIARTGIQYIDTDGVKVLFTTIFSGIPMLLDMETSLILIPNFEIKSDSNDEYVNTVDFAFVCNSNVVAIVNFVEDNLTKDLNNEIEQFTNCMRNISDSKYEFNNMITGVLVVGSESAIIFELNVIRNVIENSGFLNLFYTGISGFRRGVDMDKWTSHLLSKIATKCIDWSENEWKDRFVLSYEKYEEWHEKLLE